MIGTGFVRFLALGAFLAFVSNALANPANGQIIAQKLGWCAPHAAAPADVKAGLPVYDTYGSVIGSIESFETGSAVIKANNGSIRVPTTSFGVCPTGLLLNMSAKQFKKLVSSVRTPM